MADREEILLVEDDPDVAATVSDFLEHRGYAVFVAHTGEDGLKILKRTPVSVALLDLRLPDLDGVALMKEVRRLDCPPDVVVMTGHASLESAIEAVEAGAAGYLLKPVDFTRLGNLVGRLFEQRLLKRENARLSQLVVENDRRRKAAEALSDIARTLGSTLELKQVLRIIAQRTAQAVGAGRCSINLWRNGHIVPVMSQFADGHSDPGLWEKFKAMGGHHLEEVPAHAEAIRTRRPVAIEDVRGTDLVPASWGETFGVRSILVIPLIRQDEVVGTLSLDRSEGRYEWSQEQIDLAMTITSQAALALENARLFGESEHRRRAAESLIEVGGVISQSLDPSEVARRITDGLRVLLRATTGILFRLVPQSEELVAVTASEDVRSFIGQGVVLPKGTGVVGLAVSEGRPVTTSNLLADPRITLPPDLRARVEQAPFRAVLSVPLIMQDRIVGALVVGDGEGRVFEREEIQLAQAFASQAAIALENARLYEEIRGARDFLQSIAENSADAIVTTDVRGRVTYFSPGAEEIFGYPSGEILGRRVADFYRGGVDEARRVMKRLEAEGRLRNLEVSIRARDGRWVQVIASYSLLREASGEIVGTLGIQKDITEQKQLEETLRQSQKMEAVGRLAGGLAHDFNNLLTVITGRTQILMDRLRPEDPMRRDIDLFRKTSERAAALTRQLLAFSRKQVLRPKVLDLTAIVANMDSMFRRLIGEDIELLTVREPDLWRVKADAAQIEQVIVNLVVNARDAMPNGGKLTLETANVVLNGMSAARHVGVGSGPHVMLAVSDTGVGMDAATRARIFEPFFTTKEPGKGTGLGLATVYGIVKQSGGTIWVDSEPGRGATFKIYLPRVEEAADLPAAGAAPAEPQRGIETILVAEDEDELRAVAREALEMYGYTVLEAADPDEALVIAERHAGPIHLLVTDVVMPRMNGRELVRRLAPLRPETKVLYVSGYADDAIARHGVLDPGTAFLEKPFDPKVLARKVREVLERA